MLTNGYCSLNGLIVFIPLLSPPPLISHILYHCGPCFPIAIPHRFFAIKPPLALLLPLPLALLLPLPLALLLPLPLALLLLLPSLYCYHSPFFVCYRFLFAFCFAFHLPPLSLPTPVIPILAIPLFLGFH